MSQSSNIKTNVKFYDEYNYFDLYLCKRFHIDENGVLTYMKKMKEAYVEAREAIPEWDVTYNRLEHIQVRHTNLTNDEKLFKDFQGKDEDVVWMQVFCEKLEANADPLSKYSKMEFTYKQRNKSLWQRIKEVFS